MVPSFPRFKDNAERFYFQRFQHDMMPNYLGDLNAGYYMTRALPQGCHTEQFIFGMVVALSAASMALEGTLVTPIASTDHHSIFALEYYQKALFALRNTLASSPSMRNGNRSLSLTACYPSRDEPIYPWVEQ